MLPYTSTPETHEAYMNGYNTCKNEKRGLLGFIVGLLTGAFIGIIIFAIINVDKLH